MINSPLIATVRSAAISQVAGCTTTTYTYTTLRTNNSTQPPEQSADKEPQHPDLFLLYYILLITFCILLALKEIWIEQSSRQNGTISKEGKVKTQDDSTAEETVDAESPDKRINDDVEQRVQKEKERLARLRERTQPESQDKSTKDDVEQRVRKDMERRVRLKKTRRMTQSITKKMEGERKKDNEGRPKRSQQKRLHI